VIDRRVWIFLICALACVALIPFSNFDKPAKPGEKAKAHKSQNYRWVPEATAGAYLALAAMVAADSAARRPSSRERSVQNRA